MPFDFTYLNTQGSYRNQWTDSEARMGLLASTQTG